MKITCMKSELIRGINIVMKAVPVRTTLNIQECILIDALPSKITLTANDMELGIETVIEGTVEKRGMIALDARLFSDIVRKLPDDYVMIESDDLLNASIICGKAKFRIPGLDGADFSRVPAVTAETSVLISQLSLRDMIRQTLFSVSASDPNKIMTGEYVEINDDTMRMISLDGHRVSIRCLGLKAHYEPMSAIVPGKTLSEISKILSGGLEDIVRISIEENLIMFAFDETIVVSRLIDGRYFNVDQMLTTDYETKISMNRRELVDCIDRSTLMVREDDRKPIILNIAGDEMELKITSYIGSMDDQLAVEKEGRDIKIGFNPKYMLDALRAIDDETVDMYFMNSKSPCFIRDEAGSYVYLVLPVNFVD